MEVGDKFWEANHTDLEAAYSAATSKEYFELFHAAWETYKKTGTQETI